MSLLEKGIKALSNIANKAQTKKEVAEIVSKLGGRPSIYFQVWTEKQRTEPGEDKLEMKEVLVTSENKGLYPFSNKVGRYLNFPFCENELMAELAKQGKTLSYDEHGAFTVPLGQNFA